MRTSLDIGFVCKVLLLSFCVVLGEYVNAQEERVVQIFRGSVPIARSSINLVELAPNVQVYPGEEVVISATGSANVNQHNYRKRRCKYFGLKCWYENRSRTQIRDHSHFEIEVSLVGADNSVIDKQTIDNGQAITLKYPVGARLERGADLYAYIKTFNNSGIDRRNCGRRPSYCSSGDLNLTIGQSTISKRFETIREQFEGFSPNNIPAERIRSRNYIDGLLINGRVRAEDVQKLLAEKLKDWVKEGDDNAQGALVQLIQFALGLSSNQENLAILNQLRLDAYMKLGAYEQLENHAHDLINDLHRACSENCSIADARKLATALKSLSVAQAEKKARLHTSDITLAVATLSRGVDLLEKAMNGEAYSALIDDMELLSDLYQDSADKLILIRTPAEINKAVHFMEQSVCLQKLSIAVNNGESGTFAAAQCKNFSNS